MNKTIRIILYTLGVLALMIITGIGVNSWKENQLKKETTLRVESEMRFKQLAKENAVLTIQYKAKNDTIAQKQAVIDFLEDNPLLIIQKNDASHISIDRLDALNSIKRFVDNTDNYRKNKERYSLHRFDTSK